jgi:hypothetical protein
MSDAVKDRFARLHGDRPPHPFASPGAIATLGRRRRARKQVAVATATAGVLIAGGVAAVSLRNHSAAPPNGGQPTASSVSTAPALIAVPESALLQPADAGPDWVRMTDLEMFEGFPIWVWTQLGCSTLEPADYPAVAHQLDVKTAGLRTGSPTTAVIAEAVELYQPTWGVRSLSDIRTVVSKCATFTETNGGVSWRTTLSLTGEGFAGDESLLVTMLQEQVAAPSGEQAPPVTQYILVVRVGNLIATFKSAYPDLPFLKQVATRAAQHLAP